jgi:hypothetical protein
MDPYPQRYHLVRMTMDIVSAMPVSSLGRCKSGPMFSPTKVAKSSLQFTPTGPSDATRLSSFKRRIFYRIIAWPLMEGAQENWKNKKSTRRKCISRAWRLTSVWATTIRGSWLLQPSTGLPCYRKLGRADDWPVTGMRSRRNLLRGRCWTGQASEMGHEHGVDEACQTFIKLAA